MIALARDVDFIIADRSTPVPGEIFAGLPRLKVVMRSAIDIRNIDVAAASQAGVLVTHAEAGFVPSVVELTVGLLVDLSRGVSRAVADYQAGRKPEIRVGRQIGRQHDRHHRLRPHLARARAGAAGDGRESAGGRSLCPARRPAPAQAAAGRPAGPGRHRDLPRHRQRGDRELDERSGVRAHEAGCLLHQHVARQPCRRGGPGQGLDRGPSSPAPPWMSAAHPIRCRRPNWRGCRT